MSELKKDRVYHGKFLTMLYPTDGGKQHRTMLLDEKALADLKETILKAGPGSKIVLKATREEYRVQKAAELKQRGSKGSPAQYILEIISAQGLENEREEAQSRTRRNGGDFAKFKDQAFSQDDQAL